MIVVKLLGGMGNQMFQYAMGRSLALRQGVPLRVNLQQLLYRGEEITYVFRDYDLDIFTLEVERATVADCRHFAYTWSSPLTRAVLKAKRTLLPNVYATERTFRYEPRSRGFARRCYLEGLWASPRYFAGHEAEVRQDFRFRHPLDERGQELERRLRAGPSVAINFRRGDLASTGNSTPLDYYHRALEAVRARVPEAELYVFSDDVEWCRAHFLPDATYVDHSYQGPKFSSYLQLMSACRHFIIPNSTFAWWAAWLNTDPDKVVVAPRVWSADGRLEGTDLLPPEWLALD